MRTSFAYHAKKYLGNRPRFSSRHLCVTGPAGAGKSLWACHEIYTRLDAGDFVAVMDVGNTYLELAEQMEGQYRWYPDRIARFGETKLLVSDFENCSAPVLASTFDQSALLAANFIVIDEIHALAQRIPDLDKLIKTAVSLGCTVCLLGQSDKDLDSYRALLPSHYQLQLHLQAAGR